MQIPDAQLQFVDQAGNLGRVNVEVVSDQYGEASIKAKSGAGFSMHGSGKGGQAANTRNSLSSLGGGGKDGGVEAAAAAIPPRLRFDMHPWKVSFGLTCSLAALAVLFGFERLAFLRHYFPLIWEEYAASILAHLLVLFLSVAAGIYYLARLLGLGDAGRKVEQVELAVRRGQGDPELAAALQRDTEGKWE